MNIFTLTLSQMAFLFALILAGFILGKRRIVRPGDGSVLGKLENTVFIPALVMVTFMEKFTVQSLSEMWKPFLISVGVLALEIPLAILVARLLEKEHYLRNIYTYGLSFSNFAFMGNAIISVLYPDYFFEYLIFSLPLWIMIYIWGVPSLLMSEAGRQTFRRRLKAFLNPIFAAMLIGMVIGITGASVPGWIAVALNSASSCMSPVAMLLTGITVASIDLKKTFTNGKLYLVSAIRLLLFPLLAVAVLRFFPLPVSTAVCVVCSLAMPLGLNTIVVPSAYGKDTTAAAGMAIISHLFSCLTIPLVLMLASLLLGW